MRRSTHTAVILSLALCACSQGGDGGEKGAPAGKETVAARAADGPQLRPGLYEAKTTILDFTMPQMAGMPAGMEDRLRESMAANLDKPHTYCLTPDEAKQGRGEMLKHLQDGNCSVERYDASASSVDAAMRCEMAGGISSHIKVQGTMDGDSSTMTMESTQMMPQIEGEGIHMKMRVDTKRVGDCKA
ncbi:DUF3617 domain-containing protein [Croceibacterium aestuarii]|uniref:DUF3617 domain-containing protein n=1 Tax=Croceibacterium aestuarii TaxID=3064139 RepID=UPI00272E20CF|nr:DUF3617 domain-containing protein [Croceibacterium sp. D39]